MVPVVIVTGGVLLALLHRWAADEGIVEQVSDAADPVGLHRRRTAFLALRGVVAVAFGGAIGPEASLIAVMGEISALVTTRVARDREEERLIGETGTSASLGALYGAPTGSTLFEPDSTEKGREPGEHHRRRRGVRELPAGPRPLLRAELHPGAVPRGPLRVGRGLQRRCGPGGRRARPRVRGDPRSRGRAGPSDHPPWVRILAGTAVFALLATAVPQIRFSGHEDVGGVVDLATQGAWWALLGIALLKMLATAINLSTGWLGGGFFPLVLAGSAAGLLVCSFPDLPLEAAAVAGMAAAATVVMRKPTAVFVTVVLVSGGVAIPAALMGTAVGLVVYALTPEPAPAH